MDALGTNSAAIPAFRLVLSWIVTLLIPVVLVLTAVRLMLTPAFVQFQYNTPGFPTDPFGFTKEERLHWSRITLDYLNNSAGVSFLEDLRFPNGQPVYNERELKHMVDVKNVVKSAMNVWVIALGALAVLGAAAWFTHTGNAFLKGVSRGGWLTAILLGAILLFVLVGFGLLFVAFHDIFFAPGTWTFLYSDTLIRLFPERFWYNAFLLTGGFSLVVGVILGFLFKNRPVS